MVILNPHVRESLERSAEAWRARAALLERLEASFDARVGAGGGVEQTHPVIENSGNG
jgi:hypothetical protein